MTSLPHNLKEIQQLILGGKLSCEALVSTYLQAAEKTRNLNIYTAIYGQEALERARSLDKGLTAGVRPKLFGAVLSLKDNIAYKDHPLTAGSSILNGYISPFSATVVDRLTEEGAIVLGHCNCDAFGMGSSSESSAYGPVKNGKNPHYIAGGSSGGSAVSVQMDTCLASLGSDTGGSVRQPASFCGIYGMKPTYGLLSRRGLVAYASSLDQIGIISKDLDTQRMLLEVMSGSDPMDQTSISLPKDYWQTSVRGKPTEIATIEEVRDSSAADRVIIEKFDRLLRVCRENGVGIRQEAFPLLKYSIPAYYIIATAEASSNLARYDGIRFGRSGEYSSDLEDYYRQNRSEGFEPEVIRRILLGSFVLSAGYYDEYYVQAQKLRARIRLELDLIFEKAEAILMPTTLRGPWRFDSAIDPVAVYYSDMLTVLANLGGFPAISFPGGKNEEHMPFGLQVIGRRGEDRRLLEIVENITSLSPEP